MADDSESGSPLASARTERTVSFDPGQEKTPFLTIQTPSNEVEGEDVLTPLPTEKTPDIFSKGRAGRFASVGSIESRMRKISTQTFTNIDPKDENQERGNWTNPVEFLLSILGYCIGLGNIWRFPVLCYNNGGGAFLIPYFVMLIGCGLPLILMEMTLGQYSSEGLLTVWKFSPLFKGLGVGMIFVSMILAVYYNMITGWSLYYFVMSLRSKLPWQCCEEPWQTEHCVSLNPEKCGQNMSHWTPPEFGNGSTATFAADDYFHNQILKISGDLTKVGGVQWQLALALFVAWFLIFLVLCRGIKSLGKTAYFTSTFPFLVLLILLIRAVLEPGAAKGIRYFLTPRWHLLKNAKIWSDAASQIFFTTGACQGGAITLASYNRFKNNIFRDASIMVFGNCVVSFFSGCVCFSILGFMAQSVGAEIDDVITQGPGLTFIIYPAAVTILPGAPVWSALFFFMLTTLAFSSMFPTVEIITTSFTDQFSQFRPFKYFVTMGACILFFLLGLPLTTNGGMYILELLNTYGVGNALLFLGLIEIAVVCWRYGAGRLMKNIKQMRDKTPFILWKYMWLFVTPALLMFAIIYSLISFSRISYDDYTYPIWANYIGLALMMVSLLPIPIFAIIKFIRYRKTPHAAHLTLLKTLQELTIPTEGWGPALTMYRQPTGAKRRAFSY